MVTPSARKTPLIPYRTATFASSKGPATEPPQTSGSTPAQLKLSWIEQWSHRNLTAGHALRPSHQLAWCQVPVCVTGLLRPYGRRALPCGWNAPWPQFRFDFGVHPDQRGFVARRLHTDVCLSQFVLSMVHSGDVLTLTQSPHHDTDMLLTNIERAGTSSKVSEARRIESGHPEKASAT